MTLAHATVEEWRVLLAKATPGPWCARPLAGGFNHAVTRRDDSYSHPDMEAPVASVGGDGSNAALIVAAINALPALLDRLERAEKIEAAAREYMAVRPRDIIRDEAGFADYDHQKMVASTFAALRAALDDEAPR